MYDDVFIHLKDRSKEDEVADININTVNKYFGDVHVIKDVSLDIKSQSFTVLVGPSGCGKSTILRLIAGLEVQDSGAVIINNNVPNLIPISIVFFFMLVSISAYFFSNIQKGYSKKIKLIFINYCLISKNQ